MTPFPVLQGNAYAQYPIVRRWERHREETVSPGRQRSAWRDTGSERYRWVLRYRSLSTVEKGLLESHFDACGGSLRSFPFLDPAANLLRWSEDLTRDTWIAPAMLAVSGGRPDPLGGSRAVSVVNAGQTELGFRQSLALAGSPSLCFSVWMRSIAPISCSLAIQPGIALSMGVLETWDRKWVSWQPGSPISNVSFEIVIPAGASVEVFGPQVETQLSPSPYKATASRGGVYPNARYDQDKMLFTVLGPDNYSTTIHIVSSLTE